MTEDDIRIQARLPRGPHRLTAEQVRANQRARLVEAMVELIGLQGYCATSVAHVLEHSGVSRRSFYELFASRSDLLRAAFEDSAAGVIEQIRASSGKRDARRLENVVHTLCVRAEEQPGAIALWTTEITADQHGLTLRDGLMRKYAELIRDGLSANGDPPLPESFAVTLAGALHRTIDATTRDTRLELTTDLPAQLARWMGAYHPHAHESETMLATSRAPDAPLLGGRAPGTLTLAPDGHVPRIGSSSTGFRAHANRERILDAVAQVAAESGYDALAGQALLARAEVPENVFRAEFKNAHGAFVAALELGHLKGEAIVERARAQAGSWTEGVRHAIRALFEFFASEPYFARLAFVDAPIASSMTTQRSNEHARIYAQLLFDGAPARRRPAAVAATATAHALMELIYRHVADGRTGELAGAVSEARYLALAPFLGTAQAADAARG